MSAQHKSFRLTKNSTQTNNIAAIHKLSASLKDQQINSDEDITGDSLSAAELHNSNIKKAVKTDQYANENAEKQNDNGAIGEVPQTNQMLKPQSIDEEHSYKLLDFNTNISEEHNFNFYEVSQLNDVSNCHEGWSQKENKCYKVFLEKLRWRSAEDYCQGLGGHLLSITSSDMSMYIEDLIIKT